MSLERQLVSRIFIKREDIGNLGVPAIRGESSSTRINESRSVFNTKGPWQPGMRPCGLLQQMPLELPLLVHNPVCRKKNRVETSSRVSLGVGRGAGLGLYVLLSANVSLLISSGHV